MNHLFHAKILICCVQTTFLKKNAVYAQHIYCVTPNSTSANVGVVEGYRHVVVVAVACGQTETKHAVTVVVIAVVIVVKS